MDKEDLKFRDVFKKAFYTGVGAIFMTEEAIRQTLGEMKLPQDLMKSVIKNAQRGKKEVLDVVRNELHKVLQKFDISKEISRILETYDVQINVHFTPKKK